MEFTEITTPIMQVIREALSDSSIKRIEAADGRPVGKKSIQGVIDVNELNDKDKIRYKEIVKVVEAASKKAYKKSVKELKGKPLELINRLVPSNELVNKSTGELLAGCGKPNSFGLKAGTKREYNIPMVRLEGGKIVNISDEEIEEYFYAGAYVRLKITPSVYKATDGAGLTFYLNAVQFVKHGDKLYTPSKKFSLEDFDDIEEDEDNMLDNMFDVD